LCIVQCCYYILGRLSWALALLFCFSKETTFSMHSLNVWNPSILKMCLPLECELMYRQPIYRTIWNVVLSNKSWEISNITMQKFIVANQKTKSWLYRCLRAHAMFDVVRLQYLSEHWMPFQAFCQYIDFRAVSDPAPVSHAWEWDGPLHTADSVLHQLWGNFIVIWQILVLLCTKVNL